MLRKVVSALGLLLVAALPFGCAQNDPDAPDVGGYSTGLVITKVTAIPDLLPADGVSTSRLRLEHHLRDGDPLPGRSVAFFIVDATLPEEPIGTGGINLKYCSTQSSIGFVQAQTDITDEEGVAWGVFTAGTGATYGEVRPDEELITDPATGEKEAYDPCVGGSLGTPPILYTVANFFTVVRGQITDPREGVSESETYDDVSIQHY